MRNHIIALARETTHCRACFHDDPNLKPARVDLGQPPFIPHGYWHSKPSVVIVGQNPGAGAKRRDNADDIMRAHLASLRDGNDDAWNSYIDHCLQDLPRWGTFLRYLRGIELNPNETALANVAMCGLERDDQVTDALFQTCASRFLKRWLTTLSPNVIILMGERARHWHRLAAEAVPGAIVLRTMHYAVGGSHQGRLRAEQASIREAIQDLRG